MKNVFITGISGYLGARLIKRLRQKDDINEIVGIDIHPPDGKLDQHISFYQKDIRDPKIGELIAQHNIDTVFHLAFVVKPIHNLKKMHNIDINGTKNVLEQSDFANVKHLIAISSTLAYGAHPDNPKRLKEDAPLRGNQSYPYGYYKAMTDGMIQKFGKSHPDMTVTTLRPCTVFGPNIDNYISRMLFLPVTVCVKGYDPPVQFVHEDDFVSACLAAMKKEIPGAFNITGDGYLPISKIADMLGTRVISVPSWLLYPTLECLWRIHFPMIEVNRGYLNYIRYPFIAANKKAKKLLNFQPQYTSLQTLKDTVRSRRNAKTEKKRKNR